MTVWMATIVTLLGSGNPAEPPEVRVNPSAFFSMEECDEWAGNMRATTPVLIDGPTGKPVMGEFYKCVPVRDTMLPELTEALQKNPE